MDPFRLLLEECGIFEHGIPDDPPPPPAVVGPEVFTFEKNGDYSTEQIEYGGYILPQFDETKFGLDYDQEVYFMLNYKRKHRYSRKLRFKYILYQLMGMSGDVPRSAIRIVRAELAKQQHVRKHKIWNDIRNILKRHNLRKYYNRISTIIKEISGLKPQGINYQRIQSIQDKFFRFDYLFDSKYRNAWSRKYFPNLRFVALKLVNDSGITFPYHVPLMRTARKKKYLEKLFVDLDEKNVCQ